MRCYDGCPDSDLQAHLDEIESSMRELRQFHPEATATYFPVEECWMVHVGGKELSWNRDHLSAIRSALTGTRRVKIER